MYFSFLIEFCFARSSLYIMSFIMAIILFTICVTYGVFI